MKLTPIERGVLLALMAEGRELQENADIKTRLRIGMTAGHRTKLGKLGLIKTKKSPFAHSLTDKGWDFLRNEFPTDIPSQPILISPMNALFAGVQRALALRDDDLKDFFGASVTKTEKHTEGSSGTNELISDAAWSEAEQFLANALQDIPTFAIRAKRLETAIPSELGSDLEQIDLAAQSVFQHLKMVATKRGLKALFDRGEEADFDPVLFDCVDIPEDGEPVLVRKQPVIKDGPNGRIVVARGVAELLY